MAVADFCVCLLFQNDEVGYPGRHSLGGSDETLGYIWMDWRCSDGLEVMMELS
jgi:hypothetical protein